MTAAGTVTAGQALAESLMVDTCTITRNDGDPVFNTTTGTYTQPTTTVYTGKCRVKPSVLSGNTTVQAGEERVALWPYSVSVPVSATDVELDDIVTVTASADASLVDVTLRVRSIARGTFITARRLDCEETSG
jgi:hypothetical protein